MEVQGGGERNGQSEIMMDIYICPPSPRSGLHDSEQKSPMTGDNLLVRPADAWVFTTHSSLGILANAEKSKLS